MHLGIDLGTSNSAIVAHTGSELRLFKTADGTDVLPTALFIDQRGHRYVGRRAYEQAAITPDNVAREFKRLMGTSTGLPLARGSVSLSPEEASAEVLRTLLGQANTEMGGEPVEGAIVTIPAAFNQMQTEATIAAADLAGLGKVGLIHEPIAAAMASMATATDRSGQFLVYDLGGGTFDVALVQASSGTVNVLAHEGVNMLGGKDFDQELMAQIIAPWLQDTFSLEAEYQTDPKFSTLLKRLKLQVEKAKIELSNVQSTSLFLGDDEVRMTDLSGKEIYVDVQFTRSDLESLIRPKVDRTIELCRKMVADNGFSAGDLDRIVLVGGPSKMPIVRQLVPEALGIPADIRTDPMTAVATGAAIYAESRDWNGGTTARKSSRASQTIGTTFEVKFDYPARASDDRATLRVSPLGDPDGWRLRVEGFDGWSSGDVDVTTGLRLELPLSKPGENHFRTTLSKPGQSNQTAEMSITRTFASSAGIPATLTICVTVEQDVGGERREILHPLVGKGTMLPNRGVEVFRAGRTLVGGTEDYIDIKVYQAAEGVLDPSISLLVGSFRLSATEHLPRGEILREGEPIEINWSMDDSGHLNASLSLPEQRLVFDMGNYFSPSAGHKDFAGQDGADLAEGLVLEAAKSVGDISESLGETAWAEVQRLQRRLEAQNSALASSNEPDVRRQAAEEALSIRQEVALLKAAPENRASVIGRDLARIEEIRETLGGAFSEGEMATRADQLATNARRFLDAEKHDQAESCIVQIKALVFGELVQRPEFIADHFERLMSERYSAIDKALHDKLVQVGLAAIRASDWDGLRRTNLALSENHFGSGSGEPSAVKLAGLLRG